MNEREMLLYCSLDGLHLLEKAPASVVVEDLLGLQAQFSRNPQISLRLRASDYDETRWDAGLVKIWSHRGTIHVISEESLGLHLSAYGNTGSFEGNYWRIPADEAQRWAPFLQREIVSGNDTRDGLKEACLRAGMQNELLDRVFYGWGGLIKEMACRGMLCCKTGTDKRYIVPDPPVFMEKDAARREMIRRYFAAFGPATVQDCAAFFLWPGIKMAEMRALCEPVLPEFLHTRIDGRDYYHARPLPAQGALPACVLVPGFDQLVLGYKDRSRFLDDAHAKKLTNQAGIVFPSVILRGRIRAKWKLEGRRLVVTPFERLLKKDETVLRREVKARLGINDIVYTE